MSVGGPDECWEWIGARTRGGAGHMQRGARDQGHEYAHRLAWLHWVGPIPDGLLVRHTCDNPPCCNPAHLLLGTQAENCLDMVRRRRHGREKLTPDQVRDIRSRPGGYGANVAMAKEFGVHPQTIVEIRARRARRDVP